MKLEVRPASLSGMDVSDFQLQTASKGVAFGPSTVRLTHDAGATWSDITPPFESEGRITTVRFVDADTGWLFYSSTDSGERDTQVWRTTDGGTHWAMSTTLETTGESLSVTFVDQHRGWALERLPSGSNFSFGRLFQTIDGGLTWSTLPVPPAAGRIMFVSPASGWILGGPSGHDLFATRDGGRTWAIQSLPVDLDEASLVEITMPERSRPGWLVLGVALWSEDGLGSIYSVEIPTDTGSPQILSRLSVEMTLGTGAPRLVGKTRNMTVFSGALASRGREILEPAADNEQEEVTEVIVEPAGVIGAVGIRDRRIWAVVRSGSCVSHKTACSQRSALVAFDLDTGEHRDITPDETPTHRDRAPVSNAVAQSTQRGFDKCTAASVANMQTWMSSSPYWDANIYVGGSNRSCTQSLLTSSWVSQVLAQGWRLIPTWVGPQSPSTTCNTCSTFSGVASTARQQGINEANMAANALSALGLATPSIIYYDLEMYSTQTAAETQFVDGWTERLHQLGHRAGLYVHYTNVAAFSALPNPLDGAWIARWYYGANGSPSPPASAPSPDSIPGVSNSIFVNRRIWQYYGSATQTWGGITFNIDINVANGPVAIGGSGSSPDLVVTALSAPSTAMVGGQIAIAATVGNEGAGSAGAYRLGFYYSTDATITTSDTFSGSMCDMAALVPGGSQNCSGDIGVPASLPPGTYYLGALADDLGGVSESSEGNNASARQITLTGPTYTVSVSASPGGTGTVAGGGTFAAGSSRTVTASANSGYAFLNWTEGGAVVHSSANYTFMLNSNRTLTANFTPVPTYTVSVSAVPGGAGTVTGGGTFAAGSLRTVTASANSGYTFLNWTEGGGLVSSSTSYTFTLNSNHAFVANFTPVQYTLLVNGSGSGSGMVTGSGITCTINAGTTSGTCSAVYGAGTVVSLSATPSGGSSFSEWAGACSSTGNCNVTMNSNKSVSAAFTRPTVMSGYYLIPACRLVDTRDPAGPAGGPAVAANNTRNVSAAGRCGIPSGTKALSVNVTAVSPLSAGWLTLFPGPVTTPLPTSSTLNYAGGRTIANNGIVTVGADGSINVYNSGPYAVNVLVDVNGFFQ